MWGQEISQGCSVYSVYLYLSWLPDYLQTARGLSIMKSGAFTAVPFFVGAAVIIVTNWIGDKMLTPQTMRDGTRRLVVVTCLALCALGMAIPFVDSLTLVIILTIFPVSFGNTATATNASLCNDLLRSRADSGRAFAFMVARRKRLRTAGPDRHGLHRAGDRQLLLRIRTGGGLVADRRGGVVHPDPPHARRGDANRARRGPGRRLIPESGGIPSGATVVFPDHDLIFNADFCA